MNAGSSANGNPLTLQQYRALEATGKLTRPLTDLPFGATTAGKRTSDAICSALHTHHESAVPSGPPSTWGPRPRAAGDENTGEQKRRRRLTRDQARIAAEIATEAAEHRNTPTAPHDTPNTAEDHTA